MPLVTDLSGLDIHAESSIYARRGLMYSLEQVFAIQQLLLRNLAEYNEPRPDIVHYLQQTAIYGLEQAQRDK